MEALEKDYTTLNYGVRAMAINLPGFAYYKALKVDLTFLDYYSYSLLLAFKLMNCH
jgi:hypothetical protein